MVRRQVCHLTVLLLLIIIIILPFSFITFYGQWFYRMAESELVTLVSTAALGHEKVC